MRKVETVYCKLGNAAHSLEKPRPRQLSRLTLLNDLSVHRLPVYQGELQIVQGGLQHRMTVDARHMHGLQSLTDQLYLYTG